MKPKSIFKSRTALLGLITAACGAFSFISDDVQSLVTANAPWIMILIGLASIALRRITSGRVTIFPEIDDDYFRSR